MPKKQLAKILALLGNMVDNSRWELTYQQYRRKYDVHPTFTFNGPGILLYGEGTIVLGERSYMGRYGQIQSGKGCRVQIGNDCAISHYLIIYTENRVADEDFTRAHNVERGNVAIGNNCWIGARVFVDQGTSIGDNSVVGVHSVVTRDIPPHCIAVGVPVRVIKFKSYLKQEEVEPLARRYWGSLSVTLRRDLGFDRTREDCP